MTYKILENGVVRDATPEEAAEIEDRAIKAQERAANPVVLTKEELLAKLQALQAQIQALE